MRDHSTSSKAGNESSLQPAPPQQDKETAAATRQGQTTQAGAPIGFDFGKMPVFPPSRQNPNLPKGLQAKMENSFGQDFSGVDIQRNSQQAQRLNALAYTQGESIHFAPGEFNPHSESGRNLIGHEFAHVVQQRSGVVQPTAVMGKGLAMNDNRGLENVADSLGRKAVQGEVVEKYQSPGLGIRSGLRTVQAKSGVIQRAVTTWGGTWDTDQYDLRKDKDPYGTVFPATDGVRGVDIKLKFSPNSNVDAELIGLTQSVNSIVNNGVVSGNDTIKKRSISASDAITVGGQSDEGTHVDRLHTRNNPIYGSSDINAGKTIENTETDNNTTTDPTQVGNPNIPGGANATYQLGYRKKVGSSWPTKNAMLFDGPTLPGAEKNSKQVFETTALAIKGTQKDTYYGSVQWGWQTDSAGTHNVIPFKEVSHGTPSSSFMKAAELWNSSKTSSGGDTVDLPVNKAMVVSSFIGAVINNAQNMPPPYAKITNLPFNTRVEVLGLVQGMGALQDLWFRIRIVEGKFTGVTGEVKSSDLTKER
jgi:hypothetical protein